MVKKCVTQDLGGFTAHFQNDASYTHTSKQVDGQDVAGKVDCKPNLNLHADDWNLGVSAEW